MSPEKPRLEVMFRSPREGIAEIQRTLKSTLAGLHPPSISLPSHPAPKTLVASRFLRLSKKPEVQTKPPANDWDNHAVSNSEAFQGREGIARRGEC